MRRFVGIALGLFLVFALVYGVAAAQGWTSETAWAAWLRDAHAWAGTRAAAAGLVVALLAGDLVLPVPSSVVMTLSGALLGLWTGALCSFAGAMASALAGYALCRRFGRAAFARLAGAQETGRVERFMRRHGAWAIVLSRSVPMLTEVVSCLAGLGGLDARAFTALSAAGTLPLCLVYAWAGAQGAAPGGFAWAVAVAFLVPAAGLGVLRLARMRRGAE